MTKGTKLLTGQIVDLLLFKKSTCPRNMHPAATIDSVGEVPMVTSSKKPSLKKIKVNQKEQIKSQNVNIFTLSKCSGGRVRCPAHILFLKRVKVY